MNRPHKPYRDPHAPFESKEEWDAFCAAMRKVRDTNVPMLAREHLMKIGEGIEARQRPHAERMGWV